MLQFLLDMFNTLWWFLPLANTSTDNNNKGNHNVEVRQGKFLLCVLLDIHFLEYDE